MTNGFYKYKEINTVDYDPMLVSPEEMIEALKKAETYIGVVQKEVEHAY